MSFNFPNISTTSIPQTSIQPPQTQPISTSGIFANNNSIPQPSIQPPQTQTSIPQNIPPTNIFVNADAMSQPSQSFQPSIPQFPQPSQNISQSSTTKRKSKSNTIPTSRITTNAARTKITETYSVSTQNRDSFTTYIQKSKPMYPYNEQLISPYYNSCPLKSFLICQPQSPTNLLLFDNLLLSVKLTDFKDEPDRIYQVSLIDLKKYYNINSKAITSFKTHFKLQAQSMYQSKLNLVEQIKGQLQTPNIQPQVQAQLQSQLDYLNKELPKLQTACNTSQTKEAPIIYNTNLYPITDKGGKWLTISYLIPFLMFASSTFINHTSNLLNYILIISSHNPTIQSLPFADCLNSLPNYRPIPTPLPDMKLKPITAPKATTTTDPTSRPITKHKLIIQTPKPIIPRLINPQDQNSVARFTTIKNQYGIDTMFATKQFNISVLQEFYKALNTKEFNPADMLYIASFLKLKDLTSQISIIKVDSTKINPATQQIADPAIIKKLKGIKEKKIKVKAGSSTETNVSKQPNSTQTVETIIESQETCDYIEADITEKATLQNVFKYAVSIGKLSMTEEQLKAIKTKIPGDKTTFDTIIALTQIQDTLQTDPATNQPIIDPATNQSVIATPGFMTYIASLKKKATTSRTKKPKANDDVDITWSNDERSEDLGEENEEENEEENDIIDVTNTTYTSVDQIDIDI
jgi:hypothetical protein